MGRDHERDQHGCWSTPKTAALNISESKKRTIKSRRIVKKIKESSDEFSVSSDESQTFEEPEMQTPPSSIRIEKDEELSTILNSSGDASATLPKPGVQNETYDVVEEEHSDSPRSEKAVIVFKPKRRTSRVSRTRVQEVENYDPLKNSLESSSMEDYAIEISSDENVNTTKTFATKSNRRKVLRNVPGKSGYDSFEDHFNDPIVPNQTFPSAKKKAKPKSERKKREPRKSDHSTWSPEPIAYMRGLKNSDDCIKRLFKSRGDRDKENFMSETVPIQQTLNSRRSVGDSAWQTRTIGSPSKTRTIVRGNKTHTIVRGNKTHTIVRASNKTHTIVKGRGSEKAAENHSESHLEAMRGKKKKQSQPARDKPIYWKDLLQSDSSDSSSSDEDSEISSDDESMLQKRELQSPEEFFWTLFDISDHLENVPADIWDPNTYRS